MRDEKASHILEAKMRDASRKLEAKMRVDNAPRNLEATSRQQPQRDDSEMQGQG